MPMKKLVLIGQTPDLGLHVRQDAVWVVFDLAEVAFGGAQFAQIGRVLLPHEHGAPRVGQQAGVLVVGPADQLGVPPLFLGDVGDRIVAGARQPRELARQIAQFDVRLEFELALSPLAVGAFLLVLLLQVAGRPPSRRLRSA